MTDFIVLDEAFLDEVAILLDTDTLEFSGFSDPASRSHLDTSSNEIEADRRALVREKETKRRRVYRQRQKDDRDALQHEVDGLTMALEAMKRTVLHGKIAAKQTLANNNGDNSCSIEMWKSMATWELESLKRSQDEQKRLYAAVADKAKLIKDLRAVIFKKISRDSAMPTQLTQRMHIQSSDDALYETYLRKIDVNYARIDDVFDACGFSSMADGMTNSAILNPDGSPKELLYVHKRLHPFKFLPTCEMFWRLSGLTHRQQDREVYVGVKDPEDTIAVKFRVSKELNTGGVVSMRQRLVARRYIQDDCFVLVWKLFVEGEGFFNGMHSNESGWCRLRPSASQVGTLMEMHVRRSPMHYRVALSRGPAVHQFDDVLKDSINEDHLNVMQGLQSLSLGGE